MLRKLKRWELPAWGGGKGRKEGKERPPYSLLSPIGTASPLGLKTLAGPRSPTQVVPLHGYGLHATCWQKLKLY